MYADNLLLYGKQRVMNSGNNKPFEMYRILYCIHREPVSRQSDDGQRVQNIILGKTSHDTLNIILNV